MIHCAMKVLFHSSNNLFLLLCILLKETILFCSAALFIFFQEKKLFSKEQLVHERFIHIYRHSAAVEQCELLLVYW